MIDFITLQQEASHTHHPHKYNELAYSPPHDRITIVGFIMTNNHQAWDMHPYGCGNKLVMETDNYGVGLLLHLCRMVPHELACYTILPDGSDGS